MNQEDTILSLDEHVLIGGVMAHFQLKVSIKAQAEVATSIVPDSLALNGGESGTVQVLNQRGQPFSGAVTAVSADPALLTASVEGANVLLTAQDVPADTSVDVDISA